MKDASYAFMRLVWWCWLNTPTHQSEQHDSSALTAVCSTANMKSPSRHQLYLPCQRIQNSSFPSKASATHLLTLAHCAAIELWLSPYIWPSNVHSVTSQESWMKWWYWWNLVKKTQGTRLYLHFPGELDCDTFCRFAVHKCNWMCYHALLS